MKHVRDVLLCLYTERSYRGMFGRARGNAETEVERDFVQYLHDEFDSQPVLTEFVTQRHLQ